LQVVRAALFAGVAGYIDAICYFLLGASFGADMTGAFAANMTGNLVELGINAAQGYWARVLWLGAVLASFFIGVVAARAVLAIGGSSRRLLLIQAALIAATATNLLGLAEIPFLAVAMAIQNQAARHAGLELNVGFVTGDIQQLGHHVVRGSPPMEPKPTGAPSVILTVLAFYAIGAAVGTFAKGIGAPMLAVPAAVIALTGLLPAGWTGIRQRD
jgi:uncharacterized membrane protein YoaK (UPF0700 family)